jgi:hypothetical protein
MDGLHDQRGQLALDMLFEERLDEWRELVCSGGGCLSGFARHLGESRLFHTFLVLDPVSFTQ